MNGTSTDIITDIIYYKYIYHFFEINFQINYENNQKKGIFTFQKEYLVEVFPCLYDNGELRVED